MDFGSLDVATAIDIFLLLVIGIGPKIALVPFVEITAKLNTDTKAKVVRKMLLTSFTVALLLIFFGSLLTRLLHFSIGSLSIASGIILLVLSLSMVISTKNSEANDKPLTKKDPLSIATYPLAIPYLLNPVGIVVLVTVSAEVKTLAIIALVLAELFLVLIIDILVFRWANKASDHMDESRMLVIEKVFGFLLAALSVQLVLQGLSVLGVIHLLGH